MPVSEQSISLARLTLLLALAMPVSGCSRQFWRQQADKDAYAAISEKLSDPRWAVPRVHIAPEYESRFFDPHHPDRAPLPPDDPAAHTFMHWVDGWEGYKGWHKFGTEMSVENPQWMARFAFRDDLRDPLTEEPLAPRPAIEELTLPDAIELSLIHSREYQTQLENVYLAALDVTFQRFQFGVRYLREPTAGVTGRFSPQGGTDSVVGNAAFGLRQVLPAGTQIAVELANNTLWLFSGGNQTQTASVLSYSITQPLLLGAGRKVGLENLTQTERNLLYAVRDLARFRQQFFTDVVGAGSGGYLGLLQQLQSIRNEEGNIRRLEDQVERLLAEATRNSRFAGADLEQLPAGLVIPPELAGQLEYRADLKRLLWRGPMNARQEEIIRNLSDEPAFQAAVLGMVQSLRTTVAPLDVLQLQASLASSINRLRGQQRSFQDSLDSFKFQLGLPPDVFLTVDLSLLRQFEVISPELFALEADARGFVDVWGVLDDTNPDLFQLRSTLDSFETLLRRTETIGLPQVANDVQSVEQNIAERLSELQTEEERQNFQLDFDRAKFLFGEAEIRLGELRRTLAGFQEAVRGENASEAERQAVYQGINLLREDLWRLIQNLEVVQVSMRVELIEVEPFDLPLDLVTAEAIEHRVDLMNARAIVMDARRDVEIAANRLQAAIDVIVAGDLRTAGGNRPFNFSGQNSQLRAGLRFDAPLDQIAERNAYRESLVRYQRARRNYMQAEDQVKLQVRRAWRQLVVLRRNLETSRRALRLAALQFDSAVNESNAPANANAGGGAGRGLQGNNLLNALNAILQNQNQLIQNWTDYERNRLNLYRDMGTMEIGPDGIWNDSFYRNTSNASDSQEIRFQSPANTGDRSGDRWSSDGSVGVFQLRDAWAE